jgi:hypothetical protein
VSIAFPTEDEAVEDFRRRVQEQMLGQLGDQTYVDAFMTGSMRPIIEAIEENVRAHWRLLDGLRVVPVSPTPEEMEQRVSRLEVSWREPPTITITIDVDDDSEPKKVNIDGGLCATQRDVDPFDGKCAPRDGMICRRYYIGRSACTRYGGDMKCLSPLPEPKK